MTTTTVIIDIYRNITTADARLDDFSRHFMFLANTFENSSSLFSLYSMHGLVSYIYGLYLKTNTILRELSGKV